MVVKAEQERVRSLLADTITLLCRNGLSYKSHFDISALIGITLDDNEVLLVEIKESVKSEDGIEDYSDIILDSEVEEVVSPVKNSRKRGRKKQTPHTNGSGDESEIIEEEPSLKSRAVDVVEDSDVSVIKHELVDKKEEDDDNKDTTLLQQQPFEGEALSATVWDPASQNAISSSQVCRYLSLLFNVV